MKKKIIAVVLTVLFLINIVAAAFIFVDIQVLKFPKTTIRIDVVEINTNEVIIHHDISMYNPNSFEMSIQDVHIIATTQTGAQVTNITIEGGTIPGNSNKSFIADDHLSMQGDLSGPLTSTVTGTAGINILGVIKKTIPLEVTILTSMEDVLDLIALPIITVKTEVGDITRQSIELLATLDVTNQNPFGFFFNDITVNITTDNGTHVGAFALPSAEIPAESQVALQGSGMVLIEALNAKQLFIDLSAEAGIAIAGANKTLPFSTKIEIAIPDITSLVPAETPLELSLDIDFTRAKGKLGLNGIMTLEILNPTKIPFVASDIIVDYYGVKNNQRYFITQGAMGSGELVPENTTIFKGDIFLSFQKLINRSNKNGLFPQAVFAQLRTKISLSGVNIGLPVAIGSYIDLKLFKPT